MQWRQGSLRTLGRFKNGWLVWLRSSYNARMNPGEEKTKRWQFTIRQLLALTAIVALVSAMPLVLLVALQFVGAVLAMIPLIILAGCVTLVIDKLVTILFFRDQ